MMTKKAKMKNVQILYLAVTALLVLSAVGCRRRGVAPDASTTIYHPMDVSPVGATIRAGDASAERRHGLGPQTLFDEVTITRADPASICMNMALWAVQDNLHRGDFTRYSFRLLATDQVVRADGGEEQRVQERDLGRIQLLGAQSGTMRGQETVAVPRGVDDRCVFRDEYGACTRWRTEVVHSNVRVAADIDVRRYHAELCFPNQGLITRATRELALEMSEGSGRRRRRRRRRGMRLFAFVVQAPAMAPGPSQPASAGPPPTTAGGQAVAAPAMGGQTAAAIDPSAPVASPVASGAEGAQPSAEASVFEERVTAMIRGRHAAIQGCYEAELASNPALEGRVDVRFTIEQSGLISGAEAVQNTTGSESVARCVTGLIGRFRFHPGPQGGSLTYTYPFEFQSAQ